MSNEPSNLNLTHITEDVGNEPPEITAVLRKPDFKSQFPDLSDEDASRLETQWISWVNLVDLAVTNWLSNNGIDIMGLMGIPLGVITDVLQARGYLINMALEGNKFVALVKAGNNYGILYFGTVKTPIDESSDLHNLYEYYGCTIGRQYITCQSITKAYRLNNISNITYVRDTEVGIDFIRVDTPFGSYAFDPSFRAVSDWMLAIGVTTDQHVIRSLLYLISTSKPNINHYTTGFIYAGNKITWSPGIFGYTPRKLTRDDAITEVQKLRRAIDELVGAFERPNIALAFMGLHIAYAFYRPYRKVMSNTDTPVPIVFGIPNLNKTTIANLVIQSFNLPPGIELITEGVQVTETIPRLAGLMTESTMPVVLDDVIMNDTLAEIILQIGASSGEAISVARAKRRGPGLEDKIPLMRMIIPIMNAEDESEVYDAFISNAKRRYNRAQLMAILNRRVLLINMNRAMPNGAELRRVVMTIDKPDLSALLLYLAENYHDDIIKLMRQDYEELSDKYLNFTWFAYGMWKYLMPATAEFKVQFNDVADAIREIAQKREERHKWLFEVQKEEVKAKMEYEDEELLRNAYQEWLDSLGLKLNGVADEIIALIRNSHRARLVFTKPKAVNDIVSIKRNLVTLICSELKINVEDINEDFVPDLNTCTPAPWVTTDLFNEFVNLFRNNLLVVYVLDRAFATRDNPGGIGVHRTLLGHDRTNITLGKERVYGHGFALDELLKVLYPTIETGFETESDKMNTTTPNSPTARALKEREKSDEGIREIESVQSPNPDRAEKSAHISAKQVGEVGDVVFHVDEEGTGGNTNVPKQSSIDCETECRNKYPGTDPMSILNYQLCINRCRLMGGAK